MGSTKGMYEFQVIEQNLNLWKEDTSKMFFRSQSFGLWRSTVKNQFKIKNNELIERRTAMIEDQ